MPVIELLRGGTLESVHFGAVAVVDAQGKVLAHAGDPNRVSFTRSTLKALQALPFMQAVRSVLIERGVPARDIQYEVFGPDLWQADFETEDTPGVGHHAMSSVG